MDNYDDFNQEELTDEQMDEQSIEVTVEQGPTPSIAPAIGSLKNVVQRYSHCTLCGGRLHFNYITDFSRNTTHEKSSCPECGLDARQVLHRLQ